MENRGVRFRLYPNLEQIQFFKQEVGNQRFVWNYFLDLNIKHYEKTKKFIFYNDMASKLPKLKEKFKFLKVGNSQSLQQTLKDLDKALKACFKSKFGFPKFKKYNEKDSYRIPQHFILDKKKIVLPKLGKVTIKIHRDISKDTIKNITIVRDIDQWYASLCLEFTPIPLPKTKKELGIDLGSVRTYTDSNGKFKKPFREYKKVKKVKDKIERVYKKLSWKFECWKKRTGRIKLKKGEIVSNSYEKEKLKLQKLYRKLRNLRLDFTHKTTFRIVRDNDKIVIEDLKLKNMTKSSKGTIEEPGKNVKAKSGLNRNLLDNNLGRLVNFLEYKCKWYDKELVKVDPKFTSQTCSCCGFKSKLNRNSQEEFKCKKCKFEINADHNAAINILNKAA